MMDKKIPKNPRKTRRQPFTPFMKDYAEREGWSKALLILLSRKRGRNDRLLSDLLFRLLLRFTLDAEGCHGTRFQPFDRNFAAARLADAEGPFIDPLDRLFDFLEQLLLALSES